MNILSVLPLIAMAGGMAEPKDSSALPADGTWVRYQVTYTYDGDQKATAKVTIRSVGILEVDGKPCRWIEWESHEKGDEKNDYSADFVSKLLIAESDLLEAENPLACAKRCFYRVDNGPLQRPKAEHFRNIGHYFVFLPGMLRKAKVAGEAKDIDWQRGKLESAKGYAGQYDYSLEFSDGADPTMNQVKYTIWMHPKVPIGFAHATMTRTAKMNRAPRAQIEFLLQDMGASAKPAIAEVE